MTEEGLPVVVIEARKGWRSLDWRELIEYRDLLLFLTWRSIKVRYAQSVVGIGWAVIQPLFAMLVFTVIFGKLAKVDSEGVPYAIFSYTALVPWTFFSNAVSESIDSLLRNASMLSKVYFPRLILPFSAVLAKLLDFAIAMVLLFVLMVAFRVTPNWGILVIPVLILLMVLTAAGIGMWLTAMAIQFRDVRYGTNFLIQLLMYAAPVVYPSSLIPEPYRLIYALNPMVGVIEGFRSALLGTVPMPWTYICLGFAVAISFAVSGAFYFRFREKVFADVA